MILEVGCGYGVLSIMMAYGKKRVVGIDFSSQAIHIAKETSKLFGSSVEFIQADAENLPLSCKFDIILCCETLEHIPDFRKALVEIARCLKNHGIAIITVPNVLNPIAFIRRLVSIQPLEHPLNFFGFIKEIRKLGELRIIEIDAEFKFKLFKKISKKISLLTIMGLHLGFILQK
jgi:2-polyprenyl-3-methyl-5-hydroxy-6-metoxy-1,4-benzoquinol methylase